LSMGLNVPPAPGAPPRTPGSFGVVAVGVGVCAKQQDTAKPTRHFNAGVVKLRHVCLGLRKFVIAMFILRVYLSNLSLSSVLAITLLKFNQVYRESLESMIKNC
jgi:hypothetical protein